MLIIPCDTRVGSCCKGKTRVKSASIRHKIEKNRGLMKLFGADFERRGRLERKLSQQLQKKLLHLRNYPGHEVKRFVVGIYLTGLPTSSQYWSAQYYNRNTRAMMINQASSPYKAEVNRLRSISKAMSTPIKPRMKPSKKPPIFTAGAASS